MNILLILAIVIGVLVLVRLANVAQLASHLSGESDEDEQDKDNKVNAWLMLGFLWGGLFISTEYDIEMEGASDTRRRACIMSIYI